MYCWDFENSEVWYAQPEETIEDCLRTAKENNLDGYDSVYIGKLETPSVELHQIDAMNLLDNVSEYLYEQVGEASVDWEPYKYKNDDKALNDLTERLTNVVVEWLEENKRMPNCHAIKDIEEYKL